MAPAISQALLPADQAATMAGPVSLALLMAPARASPVNVVCSIRGIRAEPGGTAFPDATLETGKAFPGGSGRPRGRRGGGGLVARSGGAGDQVRLGYPLGQTC